MKYKNLMIDIETLGTKSYCPILTIGAVEFDPFTGKTGKTFLVNLDLQDSLKLKLQIDAETLKWWFRQSKSAQNALFKDEVLVKKALDLLREFCKGKGYKVWGNSARFDLGLIENLYSLYKEKVPWSPWNEMDVRTLANLRPEIKKEYVHKGVDHTALSDCYKQIGYLTQIYQNLGI